jgi:signal transduction histidine kinase/CheY-like chemotaxis protein
VKYYSLKVRKQQIKIMIKMSWLLVSIIALIAAVTLYYWRKLQQEREELKHKKLQLEHDRIRAEAANQTKSQFLANMSHELRTPLNAILGFTQIMSRDPDLQSTHRDYLNIIYRSSEHLLELIDDILDLSKIGAEKMSLDESDFNLYQLINSSVALFQSQAQQKELQLIFRIEPEVPQYVRGDRKKLRSCLVNPLSNAIKFTHDGSITLRVSVAREQQFKAARDKFPTQPQTSNPNEPIMIYFEIQDTGVGIIPEELEIIFEAFVQTKSGQKSGKGTGLGLAITRQFVRLMGGEIVAKSIVGEGTTIEFEVEVTPLDREPKNIENASSVVVGLQPGQPSFRILVVDNNTDSCLLLVTRLNNVGFEVRSVENGLEALIVWDSWQPHLIWMNLRMPIIDGLIATRQIRERERQGKTRDQPTVIIGMITNQGNQGLDAMLAAGCDHVVRKPISETIALETIAQYLGVCYRYESLPASTSSSVSLAEVESFLIAQLSKMPLPWVRSLNQAANEVNEVLVFQLIDQIPNDRVQLAESLLSLAQDFRLDTIVRLTQSVLRDS